MKVIDCLCGCGGFGLGFEYKGFSIPYAFDRGTVETYEKNRRTHSVFVRDVYDVSRETIKKDLGGYMPVFDVLIGTAPCIEFKVAGGVLLELIRLIKELQPKVFILGGVQGLMRKRSWVEYRLMKTLLGEAGYRLFTKHALLSFYGVPQNRPKSFIIGTRADIPNSFQFPTPISQETPTVRDAIYDLMKRKGIPNHDVQYGFNGHRLNWDTPATGIDARFHKTVGHPVFNRAITIREWARLFTYPDTYIFYGDTAKVAKQIINSIPVRLSECLAGEVRRVLV